MVELLSKISFLIGITLIIICGISLILKHYNAGLVLLQYAFWFFLFGCLFYIGNLLKNEK
ncbi:hypothetical protein A3D00_05110 [Candidatus Woesebacteria bacterium RIFCSPHIGHO2_02_FULL_38_9]|uniref:Uncharacterized protein n=1 Tax=Candidatus Woesebacteria bacterium RIFCSPHIGHO2_01_FULL_39_28 TaxID=1802496 RepID=A0A1F7YE25_9BACT|nr:MAG: hypothetical protein A2627_02825 [Candidatus Woesebacteria bacterium RIFCSPHIGHO2_01_FULL_39_28]OGM32365.1 MAG: hypothetical protein A3D00_05110 [Candidatus Woesebacteria bacterium RIFCSPHIGHO2_02_FULL_38_9]OGM57982.1 MAG: hypothetical protein A3A50_01835 [Candidatus Woesebacteria bacterium RIFCSPLOWO2_01_FULL_38_20]